MTNSYYLFQKLARENLNYKARILVNSTILPKLKELGFFDRPAASRHHHAYRGGLAEHSFEVTKQLMKYTVDRYISWNQCKGHVDKYFSPYLVGLLHDLCKVRIYNNDGKYDSSVKGHGDLSLELIKEYFPEVFEILTDEIKTCIEFHMGVYGLSSKECNFYNELCKKYKTLIYTHTADMISSTSNF